MPRALLDAQTPLTVASSRSDTACPVVVLQSGRVLPSRLQKLIRQRRYVDIDVCRKDKHGIKPEPRNKLHHGY